MEDCQAKIVKHPETGKFEVYYCGTRISTQNTFLKATEKLMKFVKGQTK
jgi:hypothetical protein